MAEKNVEKTNVTGLDSAKNRKDAEYDLVKSLLAAADYKTSDESLTEIEVKRNGVYYFTVHVHPISDPDTRLARKKATIYMPNPQGKKYPPIEKDFDTSKFRSWIIYLATTEEDQAKIWGNDAIKQAHGLMEPWEGVDALLTFGEKTAIFEQITDISGMDENGEYTEDGEPVDDEEFAKN